MSNTETQTADPIPKYGSPRGITPVRQVATLPAGHGFSLDAFQKFVKEDKGCQTREPVKRPICPKDAKYTLHIFLD